MTDESKCKKIELKDWKSLIYSLGITKKHVNHYTFCTKTKTIHVLSYLNDSHIS